MKKILLVVMGFLIGLLVAEIIAQKILPHKASDLLFNSSDASPTTLYLLDKKLRVRPASNIDTAIKTLDYSVNIRTNELGLRGTSIQNTNKEQWVALGDSFTMAVQVSEEESFSQRLSEKNDVQLWNAGVDGYSTWQETLRLEELITEIPVTKAILIFFTGNDFQDNERFPAMRQHPLPGKEGDSIPRPHISSLEKWLLQHSYIFAHYRIWKKQQEVRSGKSISQRNWRDELSIFSKVGHHRLQQLSIQTQAALKNFRAVCHRHNIEPLIVIAPPAFVIDQKRLAATFQLVGLDETQATPNIPQQTVLKIASDLQLPVCDLTPALSKESSSYFIFDGHWNAMGHRIVADTIQQCLEKQ